MSEGDSGIGTYLGVFSALMVLTIASAGVAYVDLGGGANILVALSIAAVKVTLVALFFMHLAERLSLPRIFAMVGLVWLAILMALTFADFLTRA